MLCVRKSNLNMLCNFSVFLRIVTKDMVRELIQKSKAGEPSKNVASKIFSWLADKGGDALVQMIPLIASGALLRG